MHILVNIKRHASAKHGHPQVWPYLLRFHYLNELWRGDLNINRCYTVSICYRCKEESKESKTIYIALVTPESPSGGVTYRHGVALVSLFSRDMWVPFSTVYRTPAQQAGMLPWHWPRHGRGYRIITVVLAKHKNGSLIMVPTWTEACRSDRRNF
jgi:hypothetical protein